MIPSATLLTLDDLEVLAWSYGGTIERTAQGWRLVGAVIAGARQNFYAADARAS